MFFYSYGEDQNLIIRQAKNLIDRPEPPISYTSPTWDLINLYFSVSADYAAYRCDVQSITFPTTLVNEVGVLFENQNVFFDNQSCIQFRKAR